MSDEIINVDEDVETMEEKKKKARTLIESLEEMDNSTEDIENEDSKDYLIELFGNDNVLEVSCVSEYVMEVSNISREFESNIFSRGASNYKYDLSPTLFRYFTNLNLPTYNQMFEEFKLSSIYHNDRILNMSDYEISAYAQHHGFPTNLLDFTTSHLVSLLFAVEDNESVDSIVYLVDALTYNSKYINKSFILSKENIEQSEKDNKPFFSTVPLTNERIYTQKGVFLYFPYKGNNVIHKSDRDKIIKDLCDDLVDSGLIKVILIPSMYKTDILKELINLGIDFEKIYPGIESYIKTLKNKFKED